MDHWLLPGPAGFLSAIVEALREGSSVAIAMPINTAPEIVAKLEDRLGDEGFRTEAPFMPGDGSPIDEVYDALRLHTGSPVSRSVASLLSSISDKTILFVDHVTVDNWASWKKFLEEYANASRSFNSFDRTQVLLIARGVPIAEFIGKAPAIAPFVWNDQIGETDVLSYTLQQWRDARKRIDAQAKLTARIISNMGAWDFELVDKLLELDWRELFDPMRALTTIVDAGEITPPTGRSWEQGGTFNVDGEMIRHSLSLWQEGDPEQELKMRLWAAQAAGLLPVLELKRRKLVERIKLTRKIPSTAYLNDEVIGDLDDVELGGLLHLSRVYHLPTDIVRTAGKLRDCRNKLAHLKPISPEEVIDLLS